MRYEKRCNSNQSVLLLISNSVEGVKVRKKENKKVRWDQKLKLMSKSKLWNYRLILRIQALPLENKDLIVKLIVVSNDACVNIKEYQHTFTPPRYYRKHSESSWETPKSVVTCSHQSLDINYLRVWLYRSSWWRYYICFCLHSFPSSLWHSPSTSKPI